MLTNSHRGWWETWPVSALETSLLTYPWWSFKVRIRCSLLMVLQAAAKCLLPVGIGRISGSVLAGF